MCKNESTDNCRDQKIRNIAVWHIEKASMDPASWRFTLIGEAHSAVAQRAAMREGELPIVSCFISEESWYLLTTRRILGVYGGPAQILPCSQHKSAQRANR